MQITKAFGRVLLDTRADLTHDPGVDVEQVVAAHARTARDARRHDDHIGILDPAVLVGPGEAGIETFDRRRLGQIQGLALGNPVDDVEKHHVAQLFQAGEESQGAADVAGADQRDLIASHGVTSRF